MDRTHKKLIGGLGLALVAGMTVVAAQLPSPGAAAVDSSTSITDTIQVRVVDPVADVNFVNPTGEVETHDPIQRISFNYSKASKVVLKMSYTAPDSDVVRTVEYWTDTPDYAAGEMTLEINLDENYLGEFGYGLFEFTLEGLDYNGVVTDSEKLLIDYQATTSDITTGDDDEIIIDLDYDEELVDNIIVKVYPTDEDGNITGDPVIIEVPKGDGAITLPKDATPEVGHYYIEITTTLKDGTVYTEGINYYVAVVPKTGAPDTGRLFQNLNIAKEDYLVTGLIVFFVFAVVAFGVVARGRKAKSSKRR